MPSTSLTAAIITVVGPNGLARFAPQTFAADPAAIANGTMAFPLACDPALLDANTAITVVLNGEEDPMYLTNISVSINHFGIGQHQITGSCGCE